jgi:hypothetical protein
VSGTAVRTQPVDDTTPQGKVPILCIVIFLKYNQVHINVKYYIIQPGHDTVPQNIWQVGCAACNTLHDDYVGLDGTTSQFCSAAPYRFDYCFVDE